MLKKASVTLLVIAFALSAVPAGAVKARWTKTIAGDGSGQDGGKSVAVDSAGNVFVTGYIFRTGSRRQRLHDRHHPQVRHIYRHLHPQVPLKAIGA